MRIYGILLAAGESRRMVIGGVRQNKLLTEIHGKPMICHAATALQESGLEGLRIILGHEAEKIRAALAGITTAATSFITNPDYATGQGSSIACAMGNLEADIDAVMILLADMPLMRPSLIDRLIAHHALAPDPHAAITLPHIHGGDSGEARRGNPVIWGRDFFPALAALAPESGARVLFAEHASAMNPLDLEAGEADAEAAIMDADTGAALDAIRAKFTP